MPNPLWGVADLHAHPASHLAFGASPQGGDGIFWGAPGLALESSALTARVDLQPCDADTHSGFDADPIRHQTREQLLKQVAQVTGNPHGRCGWPTFADWPKPGDIFHQQMHISWIRRAYDGGLRFLVASVTESQVLSMLWHRSAGAPCPTPDKAKEMKSAPTQLKFIRDLAAKNAAWMKVVLTAAEARATIEADQLAVVLGVEMDVLAAEDLLLLVQEEGVRQVVPIHLANNEFGGVAVYADLFNSANEFLHGQFFEVCEDPALEFRLTKPQRLHYVSGDIHSGGNLLMHGAMQPLDIGDQEYQDLHYGTDANAGHRNQRGLAEEPLLKLMRAGLLVDLAHMSQESQDKALAVAERHGFPLMNSHSGFRGARGDSERSMREQDGTRLAALQGMLGLGTGLGDDGKLLLAAEGEPLKHLAGAAGEVAVSLREPPELTSDLPVSKLLVTVETGEAGLGGSGHNAFAILGTRNGFFRTRDLNQGAPWPARSVHQVEFLLPPELKAADLAVFGIRATFDGSNAHDKWDVRNLRVDLPLDGGGSRCLLERTGDPWRRFTGTEEEWTTPICTPAPVPPDAALACLRVRVKTGKDALHRGTAAFVEAALCSGAKVRASLADGQGCASGAACAQVLPLPEGTKRQDLLSVKVAADLRGSSWDVAEVRVAAVADPVTRWFELYQATLERMAGRGVALGTDTNGFSPQVPFSTRAVDYPFRYPEDIAGGTPSQRLALVRLKVGEKEFDFARDGMATYGLIPDFLFALCQRAVTPEEKAALGQLFRSAEASVAMWEKAEEAGALIPKV